MAIFSRTHSKEWLISKKIFSKPIDNFFSGTFSGIEVILLSISCANLIFTGYLNQYLHLGVLVALSSAVIQLSISGIWSTSRAVISCPSDGIAIIVAIFASGLIANMQQQNISDGFIITTFVGIGLLTFLIGFSLFIFGYLKIGNLLRFIPYPVIGGFLAGTGWLIIKVTFVFLTQHPLNLTDLSLLVTNQHMLILWVPSMVMAVFLIFISQYTKVSFLVPLILVISILAFFIFIFFSNYTLQDAMQYGALLGPFQSEKNMTTAFSWSSFKNIHWLIILSQYPTMISAIFITLVNYILRIQAYEAATEEPLNANKELKITGLANMASGFVGGIPGFQSLSFSLLNLRMGASTRLSPILAASTCAIIIITGTAVIEPLPRFIFAAFMVFLGLDYIYFWLVKSIKNISKTDYVIVVVIFLTIVNLDLLSGIILGLAITFAEFIFRYSKEPVIKLMVSGADFPSSVDRSPEELKFLDVEKKPVLIVMLQGFLFFGNVNEIKYHIDTKIKGKNSQSIRYLILDLKFISGFDTSASISIVAYLSRLYKESIQILITGVNTKTAAILKELSVSYGHDVPLTIFQDLDYGIEWLEKKILSEQEHLIIRAEGTDYFRHLFSDEENFKVFIKYLVKHEFRKDERIEKVGHKSNRLWLVLSGSVSVTIGENQFSKRILTALPGAILGEIGFYLDIPSTASLYANEDSTLYALTHENIEKLKRENIALFSVFSDEITRLLARRLVHTTNLVRHFTR